MKLEVTIERRYEKILDEESFEFIILEITKDQLGIMESISDKIKTILNDKYCFNHENSRVMVSISWFAKIDRPFISIFTCCPLFSNRIFQILSQNGIFSHVSFLKDLQSSSLN